ncbi:MAG: InlB B-repeat-containing protein [Clostridiales bacterium]|nr:InlB B-repeat-containing protein [Clostridiales bacterium]
MKRIISLVLFTLLILVSVFSLCSYTYNVTYTIMYVNDYGTEIADRVEGVLNATSPDLAVPSPEIEGYALLDENDSVVTFSMLSVDYPPSHYERNATGTYTVVYTRVYTVNVHYIFNDTTTVFPSVSVSGKKGTSYSVKSPSLTGYEPDRTAVSGTFTMNTKYYVIYYPENFTVSFDSNGGSGAPSPVTKYYGVDITLPSSEPVRAGYLFSGWSLSKYGTTDYLPGDTYSLNGSKTLYAVWLTDPDYGSHSQTTSKVTTQTNSPSGTTTAPNSPVVITETEPSEPHYKISYNSNGGTDGPGYQYKIHGKTLKLTTKQPVRQGYRFLGWSENRNATSPAYLSGSNYTKNSAATLYAVWEKSDSYTITYICILLTSEERTEAYPIGAYADIIDIWTIPPDDASFMGWSEDRYASEPEIYPGESVLMDRDITLYALWDYLPYDLVISDLLLEPNECIQGTTVNGSFKVKCRNFRFPVSNVNIGISIGETRYKNISFDFNDSRTYLVTFTIDTSSLSGNLTVKAELDTEHTANESDVLNNVITASLTVNTLSEDEEDNYDASAPVKTLLISGCDVITSFTFSSGTDVKPIDNVAAHFEVWTMTGSSKTVIYSRNQTGVIVPKNESNLIYFKWNVPSGYSSKQVFGTCTFTKGDKTLSSCTTKLNIQDAPDSVTEDTSFVSGPLTVPEMNVSPVWSTEWNIWEYVSGSFVKKTYSLDYSQSSLQIRPGDGVDYSLDRENNYVMKSGYGIYAEATIRNGSSCPESMYGTSDFVSLYYPEFSFGGNTGEYDVLDKTSEYIFESKENPNSENNIRIHYTPLNYPDGDYRVFCRYLVWTPSGEFYVTLVSNKIVILGDAYKDWYYGN